MGWGVCVGGHLPGALPSPSASPPPTVISRRRVLHVQCPLPRWKHCGPERPEGPHHRAGSVAPASSRCTLWACCPSGPGQARLAAPPPHRTPSSLLALPACLPAPGEIGERMADFRGPPCSGDSSESVSPWIRSEERQGRGGPGAERAEASHSLRSLRRGAGRSPHRQLESPSFSHGCSWSSGGGSSRVGR